MKQEILWICPSRSRPDRLERLIESWLGTTEKKSKLLVAIDSDDQSYNELIKKYPNVIWEINEPVFGSFLHIVNSHALKYCEEYAFIGFMEDDIVFETPGYETKFIEKLNELGKTGIVHACDGIEKRKLLTVPVVNSYIIKTLGWFAPPCFRSLWVDNFWRNMADHLKTCYKFEDVMIKHYHYSRDPNTKKDSISVMVNNNYYLDKESYKNYMENDFLKDMEKLA